LQELSFCREMLCWKCRGVVCTTTMLPSISERLARGSESGVPERVVLKGQSLTVHLWTGR
jgi:hypothetical protein